MTDLLGQQDAMAGRYGTALLHTWAHELLVLDLWHTSEGYVKMAAVLV